MDLSKLRPMEKTVLVCIWQNHNGQTALVLNEKPPKAFFVVSGFHRKYLNGINLPRTYVAYIFINIGTKRTYLDDGPTKIRQRTITCPEIGSIGCPSLLTN